MYGQILELMDLIGSKYPTMHWSFSFIQTKYKSISIFCYPEGIDGGDQHTHQVCVTDIIDYNDGKWGEKVNNLTAMLYDILANGTEVFDKYGAAHSYFNAEGEFEDETV